MTFSRMAGKKTSGILLGRQWVGGIWWQSWDKLTRAWWHSWDKIVAVRRQGWGRFLGVRWWLHYRLVRVDEGCLSMDSDMSEDCGIPWHRPQA
ncbi:uncharacterized [Tachysurus ichikawai]